EVELALIEREFRARVRSEARMRAKDQLNNEIQATRPVDPGPEPPLPRSVTSYRPKTLAQLFGDVKGDGALLVPYALAVSKTFDWSIRRDYRELWKVIRALKKKHKPPTMLDVEEVRVPMNELQATLTMAEIAVSEVDTFKKHFSRIVPATSSLGTTLTIRMIGSFRYNEWLYMQEDKEFQRRLRKWTPGTSISAQDEQARLTHVRWRTQHEAFLAWSPEPVTPEIIAKLADRLVDQMWEAYLRSADDASEGAEGGGGGRGGGQA
ncbi:hypothetical protein HDU96_009280, partial [Phlyctochytrium bullatum]